MKKKKPFKPSVFTTIIGEGTSLTGDITFDKGMHVDGRVVGNISADGDKATLTVSDKAQIEGNIEVANVIFNGVITGNIMASERVELAEKARVKGEIHYNMLEMAMGAQVEGQMVRLGEAADQSESNS